jgi:hypothetical protein
MTIKRLVIKYLPLVLIYLVLTGFGLYGTSVRQKKLYNEYNNMSGVVTSVTTRHNGGYLCNIRLSNGIYGSVNNGYEKTSVGDTWINQIDPCVPNEIRCMIETLLCVILIGLPLIVISITAITKNCIYWVRTH